MFRGLFFFLLVVFCTLGVSAHLNLGRAEEPATAFVPPNLRQLAQIVIDDARLLNDQARERAAQARAIEEQIRLAPGRDVERLTGELQRLINEAERSTERAVALGHEAEQMIYAHRENPDAATYLIQTINDLLTLGSCTENTK